jgi:hypothetical protein
MFNLEQSIAEWRRLMLAAGIKSPVPLEELECHLREQIEEQIRSGISEQLAFETAVRRIGCADELKMEFNKTRDLKWVRRGIMPFMGVVGLSITFSTNLFGVFVLGKSSCVFFSHQWWSDWFACYFVWTSFTVIGLAGVVVNRKWSKAMKE